MLGTKDMSRTLSDTLDNFGYSNKRIQERITVNDHASAAKSQSTKEILDDPTVDKFLVGSTREGIALFGESDEDWMQVNTSVMCTDNSHTKVKQDEIILFRLDRNNAPVGYAYLCYKSQDSPTHSYCDKLMNALEETENGTFLSSSKYMEINEDVFYNSPGFIGRNTEYKERQGPSVPKNVVEWKIVKNFCDNYDICTDIDFVRGFQCHCPSLLHSWLRLKRPFNWPGAVEKAKVSTLPYHVVPTGFKGTENEQLQWRISFTMAEIYLVQSLNDTQRKLLISLRLMARHLLKPVAPDMTSYIVKNVVFWIVEGTSADRFTTEQLLDRILDAIDFLIQCIKDNNLPNYMIPGRNILRGKFEGEQKKDILAELNKIMVNGQAELGYYRIRIWNTVIQR